MCLEKFMEMDRNPISNLEDSKLRFTFFFYHNWIILIKSIDPYLTLSGE